MRKIVFGIIYCFSSVLFAQGLTAEEDRALKGVLTADDCTLWRGGSAYTNDSLPQEHSLRIGHAFSMLKNHRSTGNVIQGIDAYCSAVLSKQAVTQ